ncbi:hypothetical protein IE81DRAFT_223447 [Ceraceosorus guamensis]|uniref:Uncharacterized protein n=1 Tax=Ceraceosorus guamensis TaxID=1522189 RepID=A0A316VS20_9BASI|nr:hypothetical protein IE81DRAFT_223447 [Ceraceosorus guamensis]PWN40397.1 hypothetical protein IE81DRAFT_223447 [Ceraceosorus guamensis]
MTRPFTVAVAVNSCSKHDLFPSLFLPPPTPLAKYGRLLRPHRCDSRVSHNIPSSVRAHKNFARARAPPKKSNSVFPSRWHHAGTRASPLPFLPPSSSKKMLSCRSQPHLASSPVEAASASHTCPPHLAAQRIWMRIAGALKSKDEEASDVFVDVSDTRGKRGGTKRVWKRRTSQGIGEKTCA